MNTAPNALVRRGRKVFQLLEEHKASIKILTKEFTLPAIAVESHGQY